MRILAVSTALVGFGTAALLLHGQRRAPTPPPGWCISPGHTLDSTFAARQAIGALSDSVSKRQSFLFKVDQFQVIKTGTLEQGIIVSLVVARPPVVGGGGLVWVDLETGCAIVLRRYE
jgi:hypothetical protein